MIKTKSKKQKAFCVVWMWCVMQTYDAHKYWRIHETLSALRAWVNWNNCAFVLFQHCGLLLFQQIDTESIKASVFARFWCFRSWTFFSKAFEFTVRMSDRPTPLKDKSCWRKCGSQSHHFQFKTNYIYRKESHVFILLKWIWPKW